MNAVTRTVRRLNAGFKSFVMRWASGGSWSWGTNLGRTRFDYAAQVGDGRGNSMIESIVGWLGRAFTEAPIQVTEPDKDGLRAPVPDHAMVRLIRRPNPYYSGVLLWKATLGDFVTDGNAYWAKVRSGRGRVVELWWLPAKQVEPKYPTDGSRFLSHYEYNPGGVPVRIEVEDIVHFRNGLDPDNPRKGKSPLKSLLREIFTDDEAANFSAALLKNMGVPGVVISPDKDAEPTREELEQTKADFMARFGGDRRGEPLVMSGPTKVSVLSFSPEQMNLTALRRVPEERVAAVFGVSAMIVGFGVGLDHSIYNNVKEAGEDAFESNIVPTQRLFAAELETQLLADFGDIERQEVAFDNSQVRALQPDLDKLFERLDRVVRGGIMKPNEARSQMGLDPVDGGDVFYVPVNVVPTDPAALLPPEPLELPEPAPLRALPAPEEEPKSRRRTKAGARNFADGLTRIRRRQQPALERQLAAHLASQRERVAAAVESQEKALRWEDVFETAREALALKNVLDRWYRRVLDSVRTLTEDALGVSFDLDDPIVRAYLADAGKQITGITETTRAAIAQALQEGQAAGEGVEQVAARIRALTAFDAPRARTIARTELGQAANEAAITSYGASGVVVGVEVFDGDEHEECAAWNGRRLTLEEARTVPRLAHPNCVRAFGAIVDAAEMEAAA